MSKAAKAVSVISGEDGPTSVFILGRGKEKNIFKRIKMEFLNRKYRRRRRLAEKTIVPGTHTMEETIRYIREHYDAVEADSSYHDYDERRKDMKCNLILRQKPELLGGEKRFYPPDDLNDQQAVKEWLRRIEEWRQECRRRADEISDKAFPTDYHMLIINKGEHEKLEVEMDCASGVFGGISYTGDKKVMEPILKDIYLFYGVSQEDIDRKSDRYNSLLAVLSG